MKPGPRTRWAPPRCRPRPYAPARRPITSAASKGQSSSRSPTASTGTRWPYRRMRALSNATSWAMSVRGGACGSAARRSNAASQAEHAVVV